MIRQKVYQLEQAQIKIKQEFVRPFTFLKAWITLSDIAFFILATKPRSECCDTNLSPVACNLFLRTSADPRRLIQLLPRLPHLPWATAPAICLAVS